MSAPKKEKKEEAVKDAKGVVAAAAASGDSPKSGGLKSKLLIGAFVSAVIIGETFVFFFLVPSGEEIALLAESRLVAVAQEIDSKKRQEHTEDEDKIVEFDMGSHTIPFIPAGADEAYRVEFHLFGEVRAKDKERLQALFEERAYRFKHRMRLEIRNATLQELQENQLGLIQRRVLATSTEILGEPILLSVGFAEYQVLED
jgi:hypothetical protein